MTASTARTNLPEVTVTELSAGLKRTIEDAFGYVRVRGELGKVTYHSNGHVYLDLKDSQSCIAGVVWRSASSKIKLKLETGLEVVASGRITTYAPQSKYQLVIDALEPAGAGALMALLEERRKKLAAEGLFDEARKKPLPYLPRVIGVITSPTGAVIRDILHRLNDRFPRHVLVWPARVQGETCAEEVTAAIRGFNAMEGGGALPRPDVLIVARGGGSLEDLWGFNDEALVRAAAASEIPLISAVGHETDFTLIDFAADRRAPTPTAAAEMAVPVRGELLSLARDRGARLVSSWSRMAERLKSELRGLARGIPPLDALLALPRQRLDGAGERLPRALRANAHAFRVKLSRLESRHTPNTLRARIELYRERTGGLHARAEREGGNVLRNAGMRLQGLAQLLKSYSHRGVLERGFALVRGADGHPVRSVTKVPKGMALTVEVADGSFGAVSTGSEPGSRQMAEPRPPKAAKQGNLFG